MPWLGIGVSGKWTDYREALHESQMDFTVHSQDCVTPIEQEWYKVDTVYERVPGIYANVVDGSNRILGAVSTRYGIIQNENAFSLLQPFTDHGAVITHAGMTEQGLCFMVAEWETANLSGEPWTYYIMCTNSFNGIYPCSLIVTPVRIYCQNMYRKLLKQSDNLLHVRHQRYAEKRISQAADKTGLLISYMDAFSDEIDHLGRKPLSVENLSHMVQLVFPYPKKEDVVRYEAICANIDLQRKQFVDEYFGAENNKAWTGKYLGFINAYYDWLSHRPASNWADRNWNGKRLGALVSGEAVDVKVITAARS